ncbi:MAG: CopG family transcriptional regulator [Pseudomonadota bacterium]
MNKPIEYTDEPLGELKIVPDFLPKPEALVFKEEKVQITLSLSKVSFEFFKTEAKKHQIQYHEMIRHLLDSYVAQQSHS